jgi:DNA-(apurinic or apyrimidinic site) lyase
MVPAEALDAIEASDPQFQAVRSIAARHGGVAVAIVVANAIVSYRLNLAGENYWLTYASWWRTVATPRTGAEIVRAVAEFLSSSKVPSIVQKVKRLRRVETLLDQLIQLAEEGTRFNLVEVKNMLSRALKATGYEKTIFFAVKMLYYACKALKLEVEGVDSQELLIPLDRRLAVITSSSGILAASPDDIYAKLRVQAVRAWRDVALLSKIPPLRLDALIWLPARDVETLLKRGLLASARDEVTRRLYELSGGLIRWPLAQRISFELLYRNPFTSTP